MTDLILKVNGQSYGGWKNIQVTRGIESLCGGFSLSVSEKWAGQNVVWPIFEGDECEVTIGGETVITGFVDSRNISYGPREHAFQVTGRDKAADLVDSSAILKGKWQFLNQSVLEICAAVAKPFGIPVTLDPAVTLPKPAAQFPVNPGESAFEVIDRACRLAGVLPVSDGKGGIIITRSTTTRRASADLVEGQNILSASGRFSHERRYNRYICSGQHSGTDEINGAAAAAVAGEAYDNAVRPARVLMVRAEGIVTIDAARKRAEWEAAVRAGRAGEVEVAVQGWFQGDGALWPINSLVRLRSPLLGIDGDMLISQVVHSLDDRGGSVTSISLKRPNAYLPEPVVEKGKSTPGVGSDPWGIADEN